MKILEGIVRLITGVSFDKSTHSYDTGLLGAIGLGCFPERHKNKRRRKRRSTAAGPGSTSNSVQAMLAPSPSPSQMYTPVSTMPPQHTAPRSFLSPEHASRPYQETVEDDPHFSIMRAWQPFPQYTMVNTSPHPSTTSHERLDMAAMQAQQQAGPPPTTPPPPQSGFTRVRGGRANADSPYSMIPPSQPVVPPPQPQQLSPLPKGAAAPMTAAAAIATSPSQTSLTRMGGTRPPSPARSALAAARAATQTTPRSSPTVPPSSWPGNQAEESPVPPRLHVRTKSQTAIIEDASLLQSLQASPVTTPSRQVGGSGFPDLTASTSRITLPMTREAPLPPPSAPLTLQDDSKRRRRWFKGLSNVDAGESDDETDAPQAPFAESSEKPRSWFRRNRRRSEGDVLSAPRMAALEQTRSAQPEQAAGGGKSFVVMRPMRTAGGSSNALPTLASQQQQQQQGRLPARPSSSGDAEGQTPTHGRMSLPPIPRRSSRRRPSSSGN